MESPWRVLAAEVVLAAIVAAEDDDGVAIDIQFFQQVEQFSHLTVEHVHHGGVATRFPRPIPITKQRPRRIILGEVEETVGGSDRHVAEEGAIGVVADELSCGIDDLVVGIGLPLASTVVARQRHLFTVSNQVRRVVTVGVDLIVVSEEEIESVLFRNSGGIATTAAPLAEAAGGIARPLQHRCDGFLIRPQWRAAAVAANRCVAAVLPRHQRAAGRGTEGGSRHGVGETHPLCSHLIDVGGEDVRVTHQRQFVVAQLVRHDVDDVGLRGGGCTIVVVPRLRGAATDQ